MRRLPARAALNTYAMLAVERRRSLPSRTTSRSGQPPRPTRMQQRSAQYSWEGAMNNKPTLSFWQIWNMCFGFLGIQFGFALQNANVSRIFQTLGANVDELAILWTAAPLTGLLVQPIIGYYSDRTWGRFGRRRPYFMAGEIGRAHV